MLLLMRNFCTFRSWMPPLRLESIYLVYWQCTYICMYICMYDVYIYIYIYMCVCVYISLLYTFCRSRNTSDIVCRIPHALTSSPLITRCFRFDYWLSSGSHAVFICLSIICSRWTKRSEICMHNKRSVARNTALVVQRRGLITHKRERSPKGTAK